MVRLRGSSPSVLSRPGGEMELPNGPRGITPQDLGPRPGIAPKNLRMRESDRAGVWPAVSRMRKGGATWVVVASVSLPPVGLGARL